MDRKASHRKRTKDAASSAKSPFRMPLSKRSAQEDKSPQSPTGKSRDTKDSNEMARGPKRVVNEAAGRTSVEDDPNAKHFTVADVGAGGALYLKPSRMPSTHLSPNSGSPPATIDNSFADRTDWPLRRQSHVSGTYTPKPRRSVSVDRNGHIPPVSLANVNARLRTRSHSFSDASRSPIFDSNDYRLFQNNDSDALPRPRSFTNLSAGLLDLQIPHYRLGIPWFSDRGTAYLNSLRNSMYTATTEDARHSSISRTDYDRLFPAPPGMGGNNLIANSFLHPSSALAPYADSISDKPSATGAITLYLFDKLELRADDPAVVRYHRPTGRILAATPARLIAQITSPRFLDYELLADFFLSFRCFMSCRDVLEYLFARMHWAFVSGADAGRIVRVRTFVALRHWILNYFADDFISDPSFRQRFCDLVNDLARTLRQRPDRGGSDMNILKELKKCWRRTCALYWPVNSAVDATADADIVRGGDDPLPPAPSAMSLPLTARPTSQRASIFEVTQIKLIDMHRPSMDSHSGRSVEAFGANRTSAFRIRTASIPASPMSEESLDVLSCSVPFLRNIRIVPPVKTLTEVSQTTSAPKNSPLSSKPSSRGFHQHKRSGSFSDALRDVRPPIHSTQPETIDLKDLPSFALTGGLVRGILLQPPPATIKATIPLSPTLSPKHQRFPSIEETFSEDRQSSNSSVKKIVGEMRRALSTRKTHSESPVRSRTSNSSSDSRTSGTPASSFEKAGSVYQQLPGPPRQDVLAAKVEKSYQHAMELSKQSAGENLDASTPIASQHPVAALGEPQAPFAGIQGERMNSHVTTSSRSILIVDATRGSTRPRTSKPLPSVSSMSSDMTPMPLFRSKSELLEYALPDRTWANTSGTRTTSGSRTSSNWRASDTRLHDLLAVPRDNASGASTRSGSRRRSENLGFRRSSHALSPDLIAPPIRHQLRRRPGGDLKTADHVHQLEYGSLTKGSATDPNELAGTHFADQGLGALWPLNTAVPTPPKEGLSFDLLDQHSAQPKVRKSFEAEAIKLKRIPDSSTSGGIEDTLLKLEGKSPSDSSFPEHKDEGGAVSSPMSPTTPKIKSSKKADGNTQPVDSKLGLQNPLSPTFTETQGASIYSVSSGSDAPVMAARISRFPIQEPFSPQSGESYGYAKSDEKAQPSSRDGDPAKSAGTPRSTTPQGSFLLDDNQSLSDISTDIADNSADDDGVRSFFFDDTRSDESVAHRLFNSPVTDPSTAGIPSVLSSQPVLSTRNTILSPDRPLKEANSAPKLTTPNSKPSLRPQLEALKPIKTTLDPPRTTHMPFVLAFESEVLAEQLTIIEKDALDEVDWKDLMTMTWHQSQRQVRNWVDYLNKQESNGIDIVIARFNLVVKWVISEIILTEAASERARTITKFVHIAIHARRLRNYASMYQISLALLSSDLARLHRTWSLVGAREKHLLEQLEKLCSPLHNFHNLRAEMETATLDNGCIPFIGLYTHDLMINAQKPARFEPEDRKNESLINFERYQTAAMIVKSLLRLIEASGKYVFKPHPEALSRCLWIAALDDTEMEDRFSSLDES